MIDVEQLREANERLKPLRRLMDDLQKVTEMLVQVETEHKDRLIILAEYDAKILAKQTELAEVESQRAAAKADTEADLAGMQASRHHAAAELVVFKQQIGREREKLQNEYNAEFDKLRREHEKFTTALQASRAALQEDYNRVKEALALLRQQITV